MNLRLILLIALSLFWLATVGCSNSTPSPTFPSEEQPIPEMQRDTTSTHMLWGIWQFNFTPGTNEIFPIPARNIEIHYDITDMLLPPNCDDCLEIVINSFNPLTHILDVDITLRNKTSKTVKDVRGILFTNNYGHQLINVDDWTPLYDPPGGLDRNPFVAFSKDNMARRFYPNTEETRNFLIEIPDPPMWNEITFAIDVSWPGNCQEPYMIDEFVQHGDLLDVSGYTVDLSVEVYGWVNEVETVTLRIPEISGVEEVQFIHEHYSKWEAVLINAVGADAGTYDAWITASSENTALVLSDTVKVVITEGLYPSVTGIVPESSYQNSSVIDGTITGDNFQAPVDVRLISPDEMTISTYDVEVLNPQEIKFSMDVPIDAIPGPYDIEIINPTGLKGTGQDLHEVLCAEVTFDAVFPAERQRNSTSILNITGTGFTIDGMEVLFLKGGEEFLDVHEIIVQNSTSLTCSLFIPADAPLGLYDVKLTNSCSESDTGSSVFEVVEYEPGSYWGVSFSPNRCTPHDVASDANGNNYVTGEFIDTGDFDPGPDEDIHIAPGGHSSCFLTKFNSDGDYLWTRTWGPADYSARSNTVAISIMGEIYVGGNYWDTTDFDPGPGEEIREVEIGNYAAFISKFDSDGNFEWVRTWQPTGITASRAQVFDIATDYASGVFVAGGIYASYWDMDENIR